MTMQFDIGDSAALAITSVMLFLFLIAAVSARARLHRHDAERSAWTAWRRVSERALEEGKDVPPPPGSIAKR